MEEENRAELLINTVVYPRIVDRLSGASSTDHIHCLCERPGDRPHRVGGLYDPVVHSHLSIHRLHGSVCGVGPLSTNISLKE